MSRVLFGISWFLVVLVQHANANDLLHFTHMFDNSVRRDASFTEVRPIVYMSTGCAGFFLKNSKNKTYIMTARHCYNYDFANQCRLGNVKFMALNEDAKPVTGHCIKIVAGSQADDAVVFEAQMDNAKFTLPKNTYSLAAKEPPTCSRLQLIGFPMDSKRKGKATVSENCWTQHAYTYHVGQIALPEELEAQTEQELRDYWENNQDLLNHARNLMIRYGYYNCSVYGGNSGGPLQIEGQQIAIGLPFQYLSIEGISFPAYSHTIYESLSEFVNRHYKDLQKAGVSLVENYKTQNVHECGIDI